MHGLMPHMRTHTSNHLYVSKNTCRSGNLPKAKARTGRGNFGKRLGCHLGHLAMCWQVQGDLQGSSHLTCRLLNSFEMRLNFFMGKRAADENRAAIYPSIDFCKNPNSICDPSSPPELKWVAGREMMSAGHNTNRPSRGGGGVVLAILATCGI